VKQTLKRSKAEKLKSQRSSVSAFQRLTTRIKAKARAPKGSQI